MKFPVDESIEYFVVAGLRDSGYDVLSVAEDFPSVEDIYVFNNANQDERIFITNDKDFGDLIYKQMYPHKGVILFRLKSENKE